MQQLDSNMPISSDTMAGRMRLPMLPARIVASVLGSFGLLALALAAIGIYGMMSHTVSRRTHEIGIRMALGGQKSDIPRLVSGKSATLTLIGVALGLSAALALIRLMKSLLFGVSPTDPATPAIASLVLAAASLLVSYLPALRATKMDPVVALRYE